MNRPALYLMPVDISEAPLENVLPALNLEILRDIRVFIVENLRTARRFLRRALPGFPIDDCLFFELNGHTPETDVNGFLDPLRRGEATAVMSEAGCPAVADPGSQVVALAQGEGLRVVPLVGPSSILLALMGSGFNGQSFTFHGYLPVRPEEKAKALRHLEAESARLDRTQIFIETPYRNDKTIRLAAETLRPGTKLCVAASITDPARESILTRPAAEWRNCTESYDKRPALFLIHC